MHMTEMAQVIYSNHAINVNGRYKYTLINYILKWLISNKYVVWGMQIKPSIAGFFPKGMLMLIYVNQSVVETLKTLKYCTSGDFIGCTGVMS